MSLQETTIINILRGLKYSTAPLDSRLPPFYLEMINQYRGERGFDMDPLDGFVRAVYNKHFMIADYFYNQLQEGEDRFADDKYRAILSGLETAIQSNIRGTLNNLDSINYIIKLYHDYHPDEQDIYNFGLGYSVKHDQSELVSWFMNNGADSNEGLIVAVQYNPKYIQFFIDYGADDFNGGMFAAIRANNLELIQFFIGLGANDFNVAMIISLELNKYDLIQFFIDQGANNFNEAMIIVARKGNRDLVQFFIDQGADDFNEGMLTATEMNNSDLVRLFVNRGADDFNFALLIATEQNNHDLVQLFVDYGANVYNEAMLAATKKNYTDLVKFFIGKGARKGDFLRKALNYTVKNNNLELATIFVNLLGSRGKYSKLLIKLVNEGRHEMINIILNSPGECTETMSLGPVLRNLVAKIQLKSGSGVDYTEWFPLLTKLGYTCSSDMIYSLFNLYLIQNNLLVDGLHFIMDDTLRYLLTQHPALYDMAFNPGYYIGNLVPNVLRLSTVDIINQKLSNVSGVITSTDPIPISVIHYIQPLNIYQQDKIPNKIKTDPETRKQLLREKRLFEAIYDSYKY